MLIWFNVSAPCTFGLNHSWIVQEMVLVVWAVVAVILAVVLVIALGVLRALGWW